MNKTLLLWLTTFSKDIVSVYQTTRLPIVIDVEHTSISDQDVYSLLFQLKAASTQVYIRTPQWANYSYLNRLLDLGANGFILPLIKTSDDIRSVLNNIVYPKRGTCVSLMNNYNLCVDDYQNSFRPRLIPMCETKEFINDLDRILSLGIFEEIMLGPYDLSRSLNIPISELDEYLDKVNFITRCHDSGIRVLKHSVKPDINECLTDLTRFDGIALSTEVLMVSQFIKSFLKAL